MGKQCCSSLGILPMLPTMCGCPPALSHCTRGSASLLGPLAAGRPAASLAAPSQVWSAHDHYPIVQSLRQCTACHAVHVCPNKTSTRMVGHADCTSMQSYRSMLASCGRPVGSCSVRSICARAARDCRAQSGHEILQMRLPLHHFMLT